MQIQRAWLMVFAWLGVLVVGAGSAAAFEGFKVNVRAHVVQPPFSKTLSGPNVIGLQTYQEWTFRIRINNSYGYPMIDAVVTDQVNSELQVKEVILGDLTWRFEYHGYTGGASADYRYSMDNGATWSAWNLLDDGFPDQGSAPFSLEWEGNSHYAALRWEAGDLTPHAGAELSIVVYTDCNPAGIQEYSSSGNRTMNSGATLKWRDGAGAQQSLSTPPVSVLVTP